MKSLLAIIVLVLSPKVFGYVALPTAGEHSNGDAYVSDCVANNGEGNSTICETAARQAFPQDFESVDAPESSEEATPVQSPETAEPTGASDNYEDDSFGG